MNIILASQSPRRQNLLKKLEFEFKIEPSGINEDIDEPDPVEFVKKLAHLKAIDVAANNTHSLIIGADTVVVMDNSILGKPKNERDAYSILSSLGNRTHSVHTGVALIKTDNNAEIAEERVFSVETKVTFGPLTEKEIKAYISTGNPMDKAGAYGIQDPWGARFVKGIIGDYTNVMGLPLYQLYSELKQFAPKITAIK